MKLLATGVLVAYAACITTDGTPADKKKQYSCALAACVNAVALVHYALIWRIRAQALPESHAIYQSQTGEARPKVTEDKTRTVEQKPEDEKALADYNYDLEVQREQDRLALVQETAVDGLRHSDWTVTLIFMTYDLWSIAQSAVTSSCASSDNITMVNLTSDPRCELGEPPDALQLYLSVIAQPFIILCGSLARFLFSEGRPIDRGTSSEDNYLPFRITLAAGCYIMGTVFFAFPVYFLLKYIHIEAPGGVGTEADADIWAIRYVIYVQFSYPVIAFIQFLSHRCFPNTFSNIEVKYNGRNRRYGHSGYPGETNGIGYTGYNETLSLFKDLFYGIADVMSKGGLALYCALRVTRAA